jgi:hypothetical protein
VRLCCSAQLSRSCLSKRNGELSSAWTTGNFPSATRLRSFHAESDRYAAASRVRSNRFAGLMGNDTRSF